eukprot:933906_1
MALSTILIFIVSVATPNAKKSSLGLSQMQQILQIINGVDNKLACNLSSINPALLLSQGFDMKTELSRVASVVYTQAHDECRDLDLSSAQCFDDCIPYNHPITLFRNISSPSFYSSLTYVLELYSASASPIGWYDVGNPDQCGYLSGKYCYTPFISHQMSRSMPHGCCVPSSCTGTDAVKVVTHNAWCFKAFNASYSHVLKELQIHARIMTVCEIPPRNMTSFGFIIAVLIPSVFTLLVFIASCYYQYMLEYKSHHIPLQDALNANGNEDNYEEEHALQVIKNNTFLNIFSIQCIWNTFTSYRPANKSSLNFLDGIRVYSMSWVILGHSYMYFFETYGSNAMTLFPVMPDAPDSTQHTYLVNKFPNIFIQYSFYSVDTFFWLSGFLGAFSIYRHVNAIRGGKRKWYKWIPMAYITRYLRIVPMMMFATLIQWKVLDQLPGGPHIISRDVNNDHCSDNWWKILLLQANLWLTKDNSAALFCMGHLWYVQVDWQCYTLLPWLIAVFIWNKKAGIISSLIP